MIQELTEEVEKKFFKALSCLKKRDPQIYDKDARFFEKEPEVDENTVKEKRKKKTEGPPLTLRDYEKNLLQNGGSMKVEDRCEGNACVVFNRVQFQLSKVQSYRSPVMLILGKNSWWF